jgi:hypothetical protein
VRRPLKLLCKASGKKRGAALRWVKPCDACGHVPAIGSEFDQVGGSLGATPRHRRLYPSVPATDGFAAAASPDRDGKSLFRREEWTYMSNRTHLATLERRHRTLELEIYEAQAHLAHDDLTLAELKRRSSLVEDEIGHLRQNVATHVAEVRLKAREKRRAAMRMAGRKSSSWYEGAMRSVSIIKMSWSDSEASGWQALVSMDERLPFAWTKIRWF